MSTQTREAMKQGERRLQVDIRPCGRTDDPEPIIEIVPGGKVTYLWIGPREKGICYATISGPRTLAKFAHRILRELGEEVQG